MAGFLEEPNGDKSSLRLIFVSGSYYAMGMGLLVFLVTKDWVASTGTITAIATIFGAQKAIAKNQENAATS